MPAPKKKTDKLALTTNSDKNHQTAVFAGSDDQQVISVSDSPIYDHRLKPSTGPFRANWRNPNEYPKPKSTNTAELAWEFLRRNEKYALHVSQMLALPIGEFRGGLTVKGNACLDGMACTPKARAGETVKKYRRRVAAESNGKAKGKIEKPCLTFINRWMLEQPVPVGQKYDSLAVQFAPDVVKVYRNRELTGRRVRLMMYPNEMAVRFRLDLPMVKQLDAARFKLNEAAKRFKKASKLAADKKKSDFLAFNGTARDKVLTPTEN